MKKRLFSAIVVGVASLFVLAACNNGSDGYFPGSGRSNLDSNRRFTEPVTISVGLWDRFHERVPEFENSYWAEWVQRQILEDHNIVVEWVPIGRWDEQDVQRQLFAGDMLPDISYSFSNPMIDTFAEMGGVTNLVPLLEEYEDLLPNLFGLLGENVHWNLNPQTNELWSITGRLIQDGRINTFIREDWLNALGLPIPTTFEEFENTMIAFRDNAEFLLGADAHRMIPFQLGHDVGWTGAHIFEQFIPSNISEREWFVRGFDDRRFMFEDAAREGARVFNRWFNEGLLWDSFVLHPPGDPVGDDQIRLGFVGSFMQNWDIPFRAADALITTMQENVGPQANYIVITPFPNDVGEVSFFMPNPTDRFIYFPITNDEPLASLLYLDWISSQEVRNFLQFGIEGVHHERTPDGAFAVLPETDYHMWPDHQFMPSLRNFDITMTVNGIDLGNPEATARTLALGYPGIAPEAVMAARSAGLDHGRWFRQVQHRTIDSQEGMTGPLADQRDVILHQIIAATSIADFDAEWDRLYQVYLNMGAAAIMAERDQAWVEEYGDVQNRP